GDVRPTTGQPGKAMPLGSMRVATRGFWISSPPERSGWLRYGAAILSVGIGWAGRTALTGALGPTALPFIFFFPLIALAAWFGGFGACVLGTVPSDAVADYFFFEPLHTWVVHPRERWAFGAFTLAAFAILGA